MAKSPFAHGDLTPHADAFMKAEANLQLDKAGNGGYELDPTHMMPKNANIAGLAHGQGGGSGKIQSPAQHASVKKAAAVSVAKRRANSKKSGGLGGLLGF